MCALNRTKGILTRFIMMIGLLLMSIQAEAAFENNTVLEWENDTGGQGSGGPMGAPGWAYLITLSVTLFAMFSYRSPLSDWAQKHPGKAYLVILIVPTVVSFLAM